MSGKALSSIEVELTQSIQRHWPRGIDSKILQAWIGSPAEVLTAELERVFGQPPEAKASVANQSESILGPKQVVNLGKQKFCVRKLLVRASSAEIVKALGGPKRARVERSDLDHFLATADRDQYYLAFIGEEAVCVRWFGGGWYLYARPVARPVGWRGGYRVFSPAILES